VHHLELIVVLINIPVVQMAKLVFVQALRVLDAAKLNVSTDQ